MNICYKGLCQVGLHNRAWVPTMATCTLGCLRTHQQLHVRPWVSQQVHSDAEGLCVLWRVPGIEPTIKGQGSWYLLSAEIGYLCLWGHTHWLRRTNRWQPPLLLLKFLWAAIFRRQRTSRTDLS